MPNTQKQYFSVYTIPPLSHELIILFSDEKSKCFGAGCGNRTRVISLEGCHNTIILTPRNYCHTTYHIVRRVPWRVLWCTDLELNQDSADYESEALPLSYRPMIGTGNWIRTSTHKAGDFKSPESTVPPYPRYL